ncbi:gamma carbonic anhydrase family protein [Selenomonas sp. oral taxon 920]|uniref:gamma carbonic anhydrase family protein n=1 Tax=Selenomonas sp. oral taxon 920 TaxID=1884263 RepID=UPI000840FCF0|nr:gamma carbonic anhydrase family protein [Selenomonas sp. oral taxon 920]AOH48602.1 gamma carbonic anhydrase family protein [Selenomonas sp. oral taxon 920]
MEPIILPYRGKMPVIDPTAFIAPTAAVIGDVTVGAGSSIWFGAVVRGDFQPITIGQNTNIQENATIHVMRDVPVRIGDNVLVGHNAVVHCSRIGDNTLIGMGSIVMGYSEIGENVVIGAGTFLPQHKRIPSNSLVFGNPAQIVRALRDDEIEALRDAAGNYADLGAEYKRIIEEMK